MAGFLCIGSGRVTADEHPAIEYIDHEYEFAFQFPSDWKLQKNPLPGEDGAVRVPMQVMAMVAQFGKSVTKRAFDASPNRDAVVEAFIDLSREKLYKKTSRDIGAERMIVAEKRVLPSDAGITFYISTAHTKSGITTLVRAYT